MNDAPFDPAPILAQLKDFQRRTVDYVFERLFLSEGSRRFLVADEVGLGKTLVARGVIARALTHLASTEERVDVVYVCSNAAIAAQNISRLNVTGQKDFAIASRLTLLPFHVHHLTQNRVNFVSFTPGTTFDLKSRGGTVEERGLLYAMLKGADWDVGRGLFNMLQGGVRTREAWSGWAHAERDHDLTLAQAFRDRVSSDQSLVEQLHECCTRFRRYRDDWPWEDSNRRYALIGELRHLLARSCVDALSPDLVILDEFQRFKHLLDGDDDGATLARALFNYPGARTLLLSATPYKMLSLDRESEDDHYPDFVRTLEFLFNDPDAVGEVKGQIRRYRSQLFQLAQGQEAGLGATRDALQSTLLRAMCRTERVGRTQRLDAMLIEPPQPAALQPNDLHHALTADQAAQAVGGREPLEYWKSSPYVLNFLRDYDLRRRIDKQAESPSAPLLKTLREANGSLLRAEHLERYDAVDPANPRMRALFAETLDRGLWKLLWLPPSLPYYAPAGPYAEVGAITKALVFSSWNLVPDAIAALATYEAERRMLSHLDRSVSHSELYKQVKGLLKFGRGRTGRPTGMPVVAWMLPSPVLARAIDPLREAASAARDGRQLTRDELLRRARQRCSELLTELPMGEEAARPDERWYWAAPALLESSPALRAWLSEGWADPDNDGDEHFREHLGHLGEAFDGNLTLGPRPDDLPDVLAALALAGPGTCALRALSRVAPDMGFDRPEMLSAAAKVASGFRTLFNLPETVGLLRGNGEASYWRLVLDHSVDGNLQSLLDEQAHVLVEQLGLSDKPGPARIDGVARSLAEALSIRTAQIRIDELTPAGDQIRVDSFNSRCRFALRFGELRDDREGTLTRVDAVRTAFNSPFRPFILASTSIGQEGLDFHTWCHAVVHWNLPSNPVDLEQREGRVHRYKGHAVRRNVAKRHGLDALAQWTGGDPWALAFEHARRPGSDLVPYWIFEEGSARIERRVPLLPFSREVGHLDRLKQNLALYRLVFGQPRQEDLLTHLTESVDPSAAAALAARWRITLEPPSPSDG